MIQIRSAVIYMIISSFIIQYYIMSLIMTNKTENIKNSFGKLYLSGIMASLMGIIEVVMYDTSMNTTSWTYYSILVTILFCLVIMYRRQIYIDDKNYLNEMIEHHSMALLTSKEILKKTQNKTIHNLAQNIVKTQQSEINTINLLLTKIQ